MASNIQDDDIDGLLDQIDARESGDSKKDKKKKKKKQDQDVEMGDMGVGYTPAIPSSSYQAGNGGGSYGAAPVEGSAAFGNTGSAEPESEFKLCSPGNQDLVWNMCLLLAFCAFEAVFSMICGSQVLMLDFYRRLGGVFAMVYTLEAVQARTEVTNMMGRDVPRSAVREIHAVTDPTHQLNKLDEAAAALRGSDRRRRIIATLLISTFLLTVAFVQSMSGIVSMYGGAPPTVVDGGWMLIIGALCFVLDLVHLRYGVEVFLDLDSEEPHLWQKILYATYGSTFVMLEAFFVLVVPGGYVDPIMVLVFASAIAAGSTDVVTKAASALQYQAWLERI